MVAGTAVLGTAAFAFGKRRRRRRRSAGSPQWPIDLDRAFDRLLRGEKKFSDETQEHSKKELRKNGKKYVSEESIKIKTKAE